MSIEEPKFLNYMRTMFTKHGGDFDLIKEKFYTTFESSPEERDKLYVYGHFYYFICTPDKKETREELQIVGMTSLIEAMMTNIDFKDPFQYFESEFPGQKTINDFTEFKKGYLEKYGATKKVTEYFKHYVSSNEASAILGNINLVDKKTAIKKPFDNLDQLARFLYQMRSDFVHRADMQSLCPTHCFAALVGVGGKIYDVRVDISVILSIFEKSFVLFWARRYEELLRK